MDVVAHGQGVTAADAPAHDTGQSSDRENSKANEVPGENKFQQAIAAWRGIDLGNLIPALDGAASDIVSHQRDALVQRKDLAQKTKEFRKLDDASKLGEIKGLLKSYQTFIDLLTNQSKATSSAFLQVYSAVSEAPDPYPLLEASVEALVLTEDTLPKITEENHRLQKSINDISQQLEDTEHQLDEERNSRRVLEEKQESRVREVEGSWTAVLEEKRDNWEAKERSLEEKIDNQDRLLREIKASYEVAQRLGKAEGGGDDGFSSGAVPAAELEIVSADLERTSLRLAEVEARNEQLRLELAQSASQSQMPPPSAIEDDPAYLRIRTENSSLLRKLDAARLEKDTEKRDREGKLRGLEREISLLKDDRDTLREKAQKRADYEDIKRELEMLKSIEFATGDDEEIEGGTEIAPSNRLLQTSELENGTASRNNGDSLEHLLLARNKKLSNELTLLRVSHQDLQQRLETAQEDISRTNVELEKSRSLATTLENDLLRVQHEPMSSFPSGMSVAGTYTSRHPGSSGAAGSFGARRGRVSPTSSIISGRDPHNGSSASLEALRSGEPVGGGSGILPMVTAQRDRFRQRNSQLEEELSRSHQTVSALRQEIASLQKDNLDLYEKTRYVSSYNRPSSRYNEAGPSTIQASSSTSSGLSLDRYRSAYEANISPFAAFRGRESVRAYKRMSLPERVIFSITRMVLANRTSRNVFAAYCVALHLLVFCMLYWSGTVEIEKHTSNLGGLAAGAGAGLGAGEGADTLHGDWQQEGFSGDG